MVSGTIAEGALLPRESELSRQFSVSRQAVREALKVLAAKGLVSTRRRTGTLVLPRTEWNLLDPDVLAWHPPSQLTPKFKRDLIELRGIIEPSAAGLAAAHGDKQAVAAISIALDGMRAAIGEIEPFVRADIAFHVGIFAAAGNDLIERLSTVIRPLLETTFPHLGDQPADHAYTVELHTAVYEAIAAGAPARAKKAMQVILSHAAAAETRRTKAAAPRARRRTSA